MKAETFSQALRTTEEQGTKQAVRQNKDIKTKLK